MRIALLPPRPPGRTLPGGVLLLALALGGCASRPGHYYQDDGPPDHVPAALASVADAVPRLEPLNPRANHPYTALGHGYTPDTGDAPFEQHGIASWYGRQYHGNRTASGEPYDMFAMTAAHPTLPIPSYARVTSARDGRSVVVRINDRGPFLQDRIIDLSYAAATRLGLVGSGSGEVTVRKITAADIAAGNFGAGAAAPSVAAPAPAAPRFPAPGSAPFIATAAPLSAAPAMAAAVPLATTTPMALGATTLTLPGAGAAPASVTPAQGAAPAPAQDPEPFTAVAAAPWSVQFGAFAQEQNAQALRDTLTELLAGPKGDALPTAQRHPRIAFDGRLHRVLLGGFADRAAAQAAAVNLKERLSREAVLYKR